jgi:hypothetical protein
MNPWPEKNSVLLLDNCAIHHYHDLEELLNERGMYSYHYVYKYYDTYIYRMRAIVFTSILARL